MNCRSIALLAGAWVTICMASQPMGFGEQSQKKAPVMKADLPFIKCQSCEVLIREANRAVRKLKKETKPGKPVTEADIYGLLEKLCNPETDEGEWITMIDMVESDMELKLVDMPTVGVCGSECRTIARSCTDLMEELEYDLAEALFKGMMQRAALTQRFCREVPRVCDKKPPPLPKDRPEGPPFAPMTEDDYKMAKLMQQMKEMGLGGQVFDQDSARDFIADNTNEYEDEDDTEDVAGRPKKQQDPENDPTPSGGGLSVMETIHWVTQETMRFSRNGYRMLSSSIRMIYGRVVNRFRGDKTEL